MNRPYRILRDAPLRARNTFGVPARARLLAEVSDPAALPRVFDEPGFDVAPLVLGGGSNLLFVDDPAQPLLRLLASDMATRQDGDTVLVRAGAGMEWHDLVMRTLGLGLAGLENLALIPGTVGAAPIQNIGAYGVEACQLIRTVEAYEPATRRWHRLDRDACRFGYRDSVFKHDVERFIVTAVEFALSPQRAPVLSYAGLDQELRAAGIGAPTPLQVAEAVIAIRRRKLPDPAVVGNAGSFFKNPVVAADQAAALLAAHPSLPTFPGSGAGTRKLSAAWLIDACGWRGHRDGDAGVAASHALVLVNHGAASGRELLELARRIAASVQARFGVALEPEPRLVGATW